ncbi:MAG: DNA polymerase IV [Syntrophobacterales bacterium]|nr:DNA polymerase IV [Syntrophobacterales bacterium]
MAIIAHLDMDAFYAAVEERDHPELAGLPLAVGADPQGGRGRGVLTTANYAARRYGLHSAMPVSRAWKLSEAARRRGEPPVVFLPPNFRRYEEVSRRILALVRARVPLVEEAGLDEAYLDLSFTGSYDKARELCRELKEAIRRQEGLTASVGVGPNKLVAKIASDVRKPDGLTVVRPEEVEAFLAPLPVRRIPGVGPKTERFLKARGIRTVGELRTVPREDLHSWLGKWGLELYDKARGRGREELTLTWEPKSVGEQETFATDTLEADFLCRRLWHLCHQARRRLLAEGFQGFRTVVLTVRFHDFQTVTRTHTLPEATASGRRLRAEALRLFLPFLDRRENPHRKAIRLLGVRLEKLVRPGEGAER